MEIKRTTDIFIETSRQFTIRQSETAEQAFCTRCELPAPMLAVEQAADYFRLSRRRVYRIVERQTVHFAETETGAVLICLESLAAILETGAKQLTEKAGE